MPSVWARHPRYAVFVAVVLLSTFYFLSSTPSFQYDVYGDSSVPASGVGANSQYIYDSDLPSRVARSEAIYLKFVRDRKGLIEKFGPTPSDVMMFPPNKDPWPAYTVWDFFLPAYNCPHEVQRIGALGDGGKWVCGLSRLVDKPDCVIYSVGINYESSFEAELLSNTKHCQIWGYDFTVKSFGPEVPASLLPRTHFYPYGMSGADRYTKDGVSPLYTLQTMMKINKHTFVDLIKIDIESWEFETLKTLVKDAVESGEPLPFGQLQLEVHIWDKKFEEFLEWWQSLEDVGLRPFWTEPNLVYQNYAGKTELAEFSFLNVRGNNIFVKDPSPSAGGAKGRVNLPPSEQGATLLHRPDRD